MIRYACYDSPFGTIQIGCHMDTVTSIRLTDAVPVNSEPTPLSDLVNAQLQEHFAGTRKHFDFSINPNGTAFQRLVWHELLKIPYGETRTYCQIAAAIGNPNAARAVGSACNRNPILIAIPCHRVIGQDRNLTGYAGGLDMKKALLDLEELHK